MALVFKIKHQESLRRWVVSESADSGTFSVTLGQLEAKVRELFQLPPSAVLAITYVDKENDVVTLGNDHDLVDACLVQCLNPLRLGVQVLEASTSDHTPLESSDDFNMETLLKSLFPQAKTEAVQGFLRRCPQLLDPTLPIATLIVRAQDAFNEFLQSAQVPNHQRPGASNKHHPYRHPFPGMHSRSMPNRGDHELEKDASSSCTFHVGVQCDGCGMTPIQGVRYKSNKTPDFDLCSSCFEEKDSQSDDYEKMEHPNFRHGHPFGLYHPSYLRRGVRSPFMGPPFCGRGSFPRSPYGWKPECDFGGYPANFDRQGKKLDARFVKDVTISDGTELGDVSNKTGINVTSANTVHTVAVEDVGKKNHAEVDDEVIATEAVAGPSTHYGGAISERKVDEYDISQDLEGFSLVEKPLDHTMEEEVIDNVHKMNTEKSSLELKLQSLESMGFTNRELNNFLLNKNQENMQLTVDDLLVAAGWDGALRDLKEMGFIDQSTNVRLLSKYKGSIKAVVKDLVQMEKQKA